MPSFISPQNEIVKTKTIKEFAEKYGFAESHVRDLACGYCKRYRGWCSTSPKARRERKRFRTVLFNCRTKEKAILGQRVTTFAKEHGLAAGEVYSLINGRTIIYRHWMLEQTHELALEPATYAHF